MPGSNGRLRSCLCASLQVRNKAVYLQYSTRQEIGSNIGGHTEPVAASVLLVVMDNIKVRGAGSGGTHRGRHLCRYDAARFSAYGG
jgi:hypothetical protein